MLLSRLRIKVIKAWQRGALIDVNQEGPMMPLEPPGLLVACGMSQCTLTITVQNHPTKMRTIGQG
jgi:hypothetical protein